MRAIRDPRTDPLSPGKSEEAVQGGISRGFFSSGVRSLRTHAVFGGYPEAGHRRKSLEEPAIGGREEMSNAMLPNRPGLPLMAGSSRISRHEPPLLPATGQDAVRILRLLRGDNHHTRPLNRLFQSAERATPIE